MLKKSEGSACNHILFPCPSKYGKGVLVQKTLWGNLILGPTARDVHDWADPNVDPMPKEEVLQTILSACKRLVPSFDVSASFHSFSGARAKSTRGDWILEQVHARLGRCELPHSTAPCLPALEPTLGCVTPPYLCSVMPRDPKTATSSTLLASTRRASPALPRL